MKYLKKLGIASAMAMMVTCGVAGSASATVIDPLNTAVTLTSTNSSLSVHSGGSVNCTHSTISGTTPASGAAATWQTITNVTLTYAGCTALGFVGASVTPSEACHTPTTGLQLHVMGINAATAAAVVTLGTCTVDISIPSIGCTLRVTDHQVIGNGTAGPGGIDFTNANPNVAHVNGALVPTVVSNGVGFGCAPAGHTSGTLFGTYTRVSATNVNVTP